MVVECFGKRVKVIHEDQRTVAKKFGGKCFVYGDNVCVDNLFPFLSDVEDGLFVGQPVTCQSRVSELLFSKPETGHVITFDTSQGEVSPILVVLCFVHPTRIAKASGVPRSLCIKREERVPTIKIRKPRICCG